MLSRTQDTSNGNLASEKKLKGDSVMSSFPSLERYSSLPVRHLHKKRARPELGKLAASDPRKSLSYHEVNEGPASTSGVDLATSGQQSVDDCVHSTLCDVIVSANAGHPDIQLAEEHYCNVSDSTDDLESRINADMVNGVSSVDVAVGSVSSELPVQANNLHLNDIGTGGIHTSGAIHLADTSQNAGVRRADAGRGGHAIDRTAVDAQVLSLVPPLDRFASLPPKHSSLRPEGGRVHPAKARNVAGLRNTVTGVVEGSGLSGDSASCQRPRSDDAGLRKLSRESSAPTCQTKSCSSIDAYTHQEPRLAWMPLKTFDDTIREYVTDSAYQTSDSLKLRTFSLSKEELQNKIESFNLSREVLKIEMEPESDVYSGCIRVLVDLHASSQPPPQSSLFGVCQVPETEDDETATSIDSAISLPHSCLAKVNISSKTTADLVIKNLLKQCNINQHYGRFALFEKINRRPDEGHLEEASSTVYLRKLSSKERPLELWLHSVDESTEAFEERQFLLRENDRCEILWEAFALPELNMFLDILLREEESYVEAIRQKYATLRTTLEQRLDVERRQNYDFLSQLQSPKSRKISEGHFCVTG